MTTTPNLGLTIIGSADPVDFNVINNNMTTIDTKVGGNGTSIGNLDANPFFRLVVGGSQAYNTVSVDQQITFGSGQLANAKGFVAGTNVVTCNTDGIYKFHGALQFSGLNSNMLATLKMNVTISGTTTSYFRTVRGATGWDGANGGGVWVEIDEMITLPVGATLTFFANVNEAPRTLMGLVVTAIKNSKNTVSA